MDKVDVSLLVEEETRKIIYAFSAAALLVAKDNGIDISNKEALMDYANNIQKQWKDGIDKSKKEALRDQATNIKNQSKDVGINYVSDKRCPDYQNNAFCLSEDMISDQSREVSIFGGTSLTGQGIQQPRLVEQPQQEQHEQQRPGDEQPKHDPQPEHDRHKPTN